MSLRLRVILLMNSLLLVFVGALSVVSLDILKSAVREEVRAATKVATQTLTAAAKMQDGEISRLKPFLESLGRLRANDLVLIDANGQELYRAPPSEYKKDRYAPDWFTRMIDASPEAVTLPLRGGTLQIIPDSSRATVDAWDDACNLLALILTFFLGVHWLVQWLISRTLQPMHHILIGLSEIERANFSARLPHFALPEFSQLSETFNRLAANLASTLNENRRLELDQHVAALLRQRLEEERRSLAREMHDELGQCITAIRTIAVSISHRAQSASPDIHGRARTIASVAAGMYDMVHHMISRLREAEPAEPDQVPPLRALVDAWKVRNPGINVNWNSGPIGLESMGHDLSLAVFRVVQESLTNVARHSGATQVDITLQCDVRKGLEVVVRDNGRGLTGDANAKTGGFGLLGMRERVESLCGTFCLDSAPGHGVCVMAQLPIARSSLD
ncbi:sensor histidine kinase [Aromatoleum diolicum]|uniref:histidine kinase n=1 Tax=Aromatoleum diolicum TaxID=75796 RepID=A0ABX1Q803_9RHOO|nr:sensor histidine kinase [Aromatoleum diolicum]NMG74205.1 hypothetical protein [Aromatoleum diolicum]